MVAFNFHHEFVIPILLGSKVQTIRKTRRCKVGDAMQLFTGQRTKNCLKFAERICSVVDYVHLERNSLTLGNCSKHPRDWDKFAELDGFDNYEDMLDFFVRQYGSSEFVGSVHRWVPA